MSMENNAENSTNESKVQANIDNEPVQSKKETSEEEGVERCIQDILEDSGHISYNFLINASNQANLTSTYNISPIQVNALFVLVSPYYINNVNLEDMDLNIKMNEEGTFIINDRKFNAIEIKPGIRVFGITKME